MKTQARSILRIFLVSAGTLASLTAGSNPVAFTTETIKGLTYAVFSASSGSYVATYAP